MQTIYQSPRFNDKNAIRSLLCYLFISYYKFSAVRMGVKKIVRTLDATPLTYFVKISEVNSQARKVCQWSMQTRVRVRVIWWAMHTCYICSEVNYVVPEV